MRHLRLLILIESQSNAFWPEDAQTPTAESHSPGIAAKLEDTPRYRPVSTQEERRGAADVGRGQEALSQKDADTNPERQDDDSGSSTDDDDDSDYLSFDEDNKQSADITEEEMMARERERQMVLEAAGLLIVQRTESDTSGPPPPPPPRRVLQRRRSRATGRGKQASSETGHKPEKAVSPTLAIVEEDERKGEPEPLAKRRPPPAPSRRKLRRLSSNKDLPPIPHPVEDDVRTPILDHATQLDDAYARYEAFRNSQLHQDQVANNRLSIISTDSTMTSSSPTSSFTLVSMPGGSSPNRSDTASISGKDESHQQSHRHSRFLGLLRPKTPEPGSNDESQAPKRLTISGPIPLGSHVSGGGSSGVGSPMQMQASPLLSATPSFLSLPTTSASLSSAGTVGVNDGALSVGSELFSSPRDHGPGFGSVSPIPPAVSD